MCTGTDEMAPASRFKVSETIHGEADRGGHSQLQRYGWEIRGGRNKRLEATIARGQKEGK